MAIGARILSNNLSGKTANVTFTSLTGTSEDLGLKTIPFNNINSYPYGIYDLYFEEYDHTYSLLVPDPTPLELTLEVEYSAGSINAIYTLLSNRPVSEELNVTFENILYFFTGSPITISTGVTISFGGISGQTIVVVDESYDNLEDYAFTQLSGTPSGSTWEIIVINPPIPTPTPTPTETESPTPTPSSTESPLETPTPTPTPSSTEEPQPTPTPTPTSTLPSENIIDAILIDDGSYLSVGGDEYLKFIDPVS
jgi:hypothetical protein